MMKPIGNLITLDKAMEIAFSNMKKIEGTEEVHILDAMGRVLAEDIISAINVPSFARGTMDGYAVISGDTFGAGKFKPVKLNSIENIHAGEIPRLKINHGECSQIATGAMVPDGADAVVKVENTECDGDMISFYEPIYPGKNICPPGEDVKSGDKVLSAGDFLSPGKVGVLSALGMEYVSVLRKPYCVIIPTGNEVKPPGSTLEKGQIYDINSYTMDGILKSHGAKTLIHPEIVEDNMENIEKMFNKYKDADLLIFSGGSSVGERDIIVEAIKRHGEILFHGIAVKPGKPTLLGKIDKNLIFGMPGNPASCLSNTYIMLIPLIRKMAGLPEYIMNKVKLPLARRINSELGRHQIITVRIVDGKIEPAFKTSGAITSISSADGYIEVPVFVDLMEKGDFAEAILF